jgi:cytochrome c oxidase subunit 4
MAAPVTARTTLFVWIALLALATLSYGLSFLALGTAGVIVTLGIAVAKAVLIAAYFMHLIEQGSPSRWAFAVGLTLAAILLVMVGADVLSRGGFDLRPPM